MLAESQRLVLENLRSVLTIKIVSDGILRFHLPLKRFFKLTSILCQADSSVSGPKVWRAIWWSQLLSTPWKEQLITNKHGIHVAVWYLRSWKCAYGSFRHMFGDKERFRNMNITSKHGISRMRYKFATVKRKLVLYIVHFQWQILCISQCNELTCFSFTFFQCEIRRPYWNVFLRNVSANFRICSDIIARPEENLFKKRSLQSRLAITRFVIGINSTGN